MRINRNMLLKLADDTVDRTVHSDRTIMAVYLQGSLLTDSPLIGNTADIDLFFIHSDEVKVEREIIRISDEVHLDLAHHSHSIYRQPRELRLHPWLGPAIYNCKILYDPQHFVDFVQASVRGQFTTPQNVIHRARQQAEHARQIWEAFDEQLKAPEAKDVALYMRALEHAVQAFAGLNGPILTERRFLIELPGRTEALHKPGLYPGLLGLLGAPSIEARQMTAWLPAWRSAYQALPMLAAPVRLHPSRLAYYERAFDELMGGEAPQKALWPLWRTWTDAICSLPERPEQHAAWQEAGNQLGLLGEAFIEKVKGLDAYLDQVEELLDAWARDMGV